MHLLSKPETILMQPILAATWGRVGGKNVKENETQKEHMTKWITLEMNKYSILDRAVEWYMR